MSKYIPASPTTSEQEQGERIKWLREHKTLTQTDLALKANVSIDSVQAIEHGNKIKTIELCHIANALQARIDWIMYGTSESVPNPPEGWRSHRRKNE